MKIIFTKHALKDKFTRLSRHKFHLTTKDIESVIQGPDHIDTISDHPKVIVSKEFDKKHVLRVVYKKQGGIIKVITFYPAEKGRYY